MRESLIEAGLYVSVRGHIGVLSGHSVNVDGSEHTSYGVDFEADSPRNGTVTWWCTADELEQVRGV